MSEQVAQTEARIKEASKLGFERMFCATKENLTDSIEPIIHLKQLKGLIL